MHTRPLCGFDSLLLPLSSCSLLLLFSFFSFYFSFFFFFGSSPPVHPHLTRFPALLAGKQSTHSKSFPISFRPRHGSQPPSSSTPVSPSAASSSFFPDHALVNIHTSESGTFLLSRLAPSKREKRLFGLWGNRHPPSGLFPTVSPAYAHNRAFVHWRFFFGG